MKKKRCFQRLNKKEKQEVKIHIAPAIRKLKHLWDFYNETQISSGQRKYAGGELSHAQRTIS